MAKRQTKAERERQALAKMYEDKAQRLAARYRQAATTWEGAFKEEFLTDVIDGTDKFVLARAKAIIREKDHALEDKLKRMGATGEFGAPLIVVHPPAHTSYELFDLPLDHVIRWMGSDLWELAEARMALDEFEVEIESSEIETLLREGRQGRGEVADLTDEQVRYLYIVSK